MIRDLTKLISVCIKILLKIIYQNLGLDKIVDDLLYNLSKKSDLDKFRESSLHQVKCIKSVSKFKKVIEQSRVD